MSNVIKTTLLLGAMSALFLMIGELLGGGQGLLIGLVFAAAMNLGSYWFSDKIVLSMYGAREVGPGHRLYEVVSRLAQRAGLPQPRVYIIPEASPNAFATGRNPDHAAVAATEGILQILSDDELEGVIAHELSHVAHRDVAIMTLASFFAMVAGFITRWGFFFGGGFGGGDDDNNSGNAFIVVLLVSIAVYALSFVLIRTLSRYREFAADRGAAILTKSPSSLASALVKISGAMGRIPQRDMRMAEGLNQFFIIPAGLKNGLSNVFADHPPLEARLEQLRRLERGLEGL